MTKDKTEKPENNIKVSVIIPVYNTEDFVRETVESIRHQTLRDIEIILINDGSTDRSLQILETLKQEDPRIKVHSQDNKGQSVSRNRGIEYAKGKYIYFMDSDDLLEDTALETCYQKCERMDLDFAFFDGISFSEKDASSSLELNYQRTHLCDEQIHPGYEILEKQLLAYCYSPSPCLNFIRHSFLQENSLHFYPGIIHEDALFTTLLYLHASKVAAVPHAFFHRRMRKDSTMTRQFAWRNMEGYLTVTSELLRFSTSCPEHIRRIIHLDLSLMLDAAVWQAHTLPFKQRIRLAAICLQKYRKFVAPRTYGVLLLKGWVHKN